MADSQQMEVLICHACTDHKVSATGARAYERGGFGVKTPFELNVLQNCIACATEINCFRILVAY